MKINEIKEFNRDDCMIEVIHNEWEYLFKRDKQFINLFFNRNDYIDKNEIIVEIYEKVNVYPNMNIELEYEPLDWFVIDISKCKNHNEVLENVLDVLEKRIW